MVRRLIVLLVLCSAGCGGVSKPEVNRATDQILQDEDVATSSVAVCRSGPASNDSSRACDDVLSRLKSIKESATNLKDLAK